jgi:ABC-2 type transport system permease protein
MNKILLIIQREYLSRVKKKSFLVLTFVVPFLFVGMIALISYLAINQDSMGDKKVISVVDETGWFSGKLKNSASIQFSYETEPYTSVKANFSKSESDYLLHIPASFENLELLGKKKPSAFTNQAIEERINAVAQAHRLADAHIDSAVLAGVQKPLHVEVKQITEKGEQDAHSIVTFIIGMLCAILIYMSLFIYGVQVMRGVIEEKVSRIIEVIISSVKPFQLMMGKIIGVGAVGLTQFVLWIALSVTLFYVAGPTLMQRTMKSRTEQVQKMQAAAADAPQAVQATPPQGDNEMGEMLRSLSNINVPYTIGCFLFYFLFGYLLYSAIFAAVGSAVDSETETQQFILPVTLPLVFTFMLAQSVIINNPDSTLSVWLSMIPFTSPIAMMIRLQFGVPVWQLATSMALLAGGFVVTVWVAGRIYRVGILMYGKKASYKELARWFTYKE